MSELYYKIPKDFRWMQDGDNPYNIGGRSTDISQIAHSLITYVKNRYSINEVPESLQDEMDDLLDILCKGEIIIRDAIELISKYVIEEERIELLK